MSPASRASRTAGVAALVVGGALFFAPKPASAADPWVERRLTLPARNFAFDFGIGFGHEPQPRPANDINGAGMNFEFAVAPIHHLELGLRTGPRFGNDGVAVGSDYYARVFDHETLTGPAAGTDTFANPEFRIRGELVDLEPFELGLEGRVNLPFAHYGNRGSYFGTEFGVPLAIHIANVVRLDTGVWVPVTYTSPVLWAIDVPVDVWIQITRGFWLGPRVGFRHTDFGNPNGDPFRPDRSRDDILFGFGLGWQVASFVDLKTQVLFPAVNHNDPGQAFGAGFAVELRIE